MAQKIELKARVEKVVRKAGKAEAEMLVTIPMTMSTEVPLGAVKIEIQSLQSAMFNAEEEEKKLGKKPKK